MHKIGRIATQSGWEESAHPYGDRGMPCDIKGTLSLHIKNSYVKHFDPLSTVIPSKNSFEFSNPPKIATQVEISVLNRDKMVSMAPHFDPYRRQWLHNLIQIGVNGSRISSTSASMGPNSQPRISQRLLVSLLYHHKIFNSLHSSVEPMWMKFWSH